MIGSMKYCAEIINILAKNGKDADIKLVHANYTAEGLVAVIEDQFNKQQYELKLKPIKGGVVE